MRRRSGMPRLLARGFTWRLSTFNASSHVALFISTRAVELIDSTSRLPTMASIRQSKICGSCLRALQGRKAGLATRPFSTTSPQKLQEQQQEVEARGQPPAETIPRWQQTPAAMKMPYRLRPLPEQPAWNVNTQQEPLDLMYDRFFGNRARGRDMLPEEVKVSFARPASHFAPLCMHLDGRMR